jgi:hypothetical protein
MTETPQAAAQFLIELADRAQAHWPEGVVLDSAERVRLRKIGNSIAWNDKETQIAIQPSPSKEA